MADPARHIVLMGMMASGKSTVGRALAARLGVAYVDNDVELRHRAGKDAAAVAGERGVEALHQLEHDILADVVERRDGAVIGAPGSVAIDTGAGEILRGQRVVWLRARLETLVERLRDDHMRPLLGDHTETAIAALMADREPGYARLASMVVDVEGLTADEIASQIAASA